MKRTCLVLLLSALATQGLFAQAAGAPAAAPKPAAQRPPPPPPLTKDQNAEVSKAFGDALKSDSDLATQYQDIKDKQKALGEEQKAFQEKLNKALVAADPNLSDIVSTHPNLHPNPPPPPKPTPAPKAAATPKPKPAPKASSGASTNAAPTSPAKSGD